jgi:hypothetical protein
MGTYFKPWRRKIGLVTLILACVFATGWIRGLSRRDKLIINGESTTVVVWLNNQLVSSMSGITAGVYWRDEGVGQPKSTSMNWSSLPILTSEQVNTCLSQDAAFRNSPEWAAEGNWERKFVGFCFFGAKNRTLVFAPYWSIVIPLTLLSAWLLLAKTHKPKAGVEPILETAS